MISYYIQLCFAAFFFGFGLCSAAYLLIFIASPKLSKELERDLKTTVVNALIDYQNLEQFIKDSDPKKETKI